MSSDNNMELSRRKILASMGAVGAAGAAAGIGTSALYNNTEKIANNSLMAGELDLKLDWEEHYSFPQVYNESFGDSDFTDPTDEGGTSLNVTRSDPANDSSKNENDYVGLPDPDHPVVWAKKNDDPTSSGQSSLELYFQNTVIEAFPDNKGLPISGTFTGTTSGGDPVVQHPCKMLADVPDPGFSTYNYQNPPSGENFQDPGRTWNADTYDNSTGEPEPILSLTDVKPGDFGEFTFSTHLCDNPGYLWLTMPNFDSSENTIEEAEGSIGNDSTPGDGELEEKIRTTVWYDDNCNNRIDGGQDLVALAIVDTSGSNASIISDIRTAANQLVADLKAEQDSDTRIYAGVIRYDNSGDDNDIILEVPIQNIDDYGSPAFDSDNLPNTSGNSPIPHSLDVGREYLNDVAADLANNSHPTITDANVEDPNKQIVLVSDGRPSYQTSGTDAQGDLLDGSTLPSPEPMDPDESDPGIDLFDYDGTTYRSDFFDGLANESPVELPDPDGGTISGQNRAETALVARDIDGKPFLPPSDPQHQTAGPKTDLDDGEGPNNDPADISGDNDVTVRAVAVYDTNGDSPTEIDRTRDTMTAFASNANAYYDLPMAGAGSVATDLVNDLNVKGTEQTIFQNISLKELNNRLPIQLDSNLDTSEKECFSAGVTHCFGLAWWLPTDVGNEVQSDSVKFDLGFYTEQCRNNDNPDGP